MVDQTFSLYIPSLYTSNTLETISATLEKYGTVKEVEFFPIVFPTPSTAFCKALVYFSEWKTNNEVAELHRKIIADGKYLFYVDETKRNYWVLKKNNPALDTCSNSTSSGATTIASSFSLDEATFPALTANAATVVEEESKVEVDPVATASDPIVEEPQVEVEVPQELLQEPQEEPPQPTFATFYPQQHQHQHQHQLSPFHHLEMQRLLHENNTLREELQQSVNFYQNQLEFIASFYQAQMNHLLER